MAKAPLPTKDHAFKRWMVLGKPSHRELAARLREEGFAIDHVTLFRWAKQNPEWIVEQTEAEEPAASRLTVVLRGLAAHAGEVKPDVYRGLGAELVLKAVDVVRTMRADSPDDLHKILDAADRVRGWAHDAKGALIADTAGLKTIEAKPAEVPKKGVLAVIEAPRAAAQPPLKVPKQASH